MALRRERTKGRGHRLQAQLETRAVSTPGFAYVLKQAAYLGLEVRAFLHLIAAQRHASPEP